MNKKADTRTKTFHNARKPVAWHIAGLTLLVAAVFYAQQPSAAADIVVYKSPTCGCCKAWVTHLENSGFSVEVHNRNDMEPVKAAMGIPANLQSCHSAEAAGYVIEGHVPADLIAHLLEEKPNIKGLAVPGMPMGSPGMEGPRKDDYAILAIQPNGQTNVYAER